MDGAPGGSRALAGAVRARLGEVPDCDSPPVSAVVVSHDGEDHLRTLLDGLTRWTDYPNLELIVVDNGSADGSLDLLRRAHTPFPLRILANPHNESFSDANNRGAAAARGPLLLFLNNDVEPFEPGWLRELVAGLRGGEAGAVGATLVFPHEDAERFEHGFAVQHRGLRFRDEGGVLGPALHDWEADPLDESLGVDVESAAAVAACLLIEAEAFAEVGGFTHGYLYGAEDIDLCLKLREAGRSVLCSGRALAIHRPGSTRRAIEFERARERKLRNHRLLLERWGPRLRREHDLCAIDGGGIWVQRGREDGAAAATGSAAEAPGVCVRCTGTEAVHDDALEALDEEAERRGLRHLTLRGAESDDPRGLEYDVAIHVRGPARYMPAPGQLNVLWAPEGTGEPSVAERAEHDIVLGGGAADALRMALTTAADRQRRIGPETTAPGRVGGAATG